MPATDHPFWLDFALNAVCIVVVMYLGNLGAKRLRLSSNLGAAMISAAVFLVIYLAAVLFQVSFVIISFHGGISWRRPDALLGSLIVMLFASGALAFWEAFKRRSVSKR